MRKKADLVLLLVALAFAASCWCRWMWPDRWWSLLFFYMSEAGLVGGIADWFAVTALFRRPLGLPLKHTAIIPKNREKLIAGVAGMVETQLLPPDRVKLHIDRFQIVKTAMKRIDPYVKDGTVERLGWRALETALDSIDLAAVATALDRLVREGLRSATLAPYAGKALGAAADSGAFNKLFDRTIEAAKDIVASPETKPAIRKMLEEEKERKLNEGGWLTRLFKQTAAAFAESADMLNLDEAAEVFHRDLLVFLEELKTADHPLRLFIAERVRELADRLENDPVLAAKTDAWMKETMANVDLSAAIEAMLGRIRQSLASEETDSLKKWAGKLLTGYWEQFCRSDHMQLVLEDHIKRLLAVFVDREHRLLGAIVRETLDAFTKERLNAFVESKVGRDLARIRINGSLLGAAIGAAMYVILHLVYDPILDMIR